MPVGDGKSRAGRIAYVVRVGGAQDAGGIAGRSADIAVKRKRAGRKQGLLQGECGGDVARAAKAPGFSTGDEGYAGLYRELTVATLRFVVRYHDQRAVVTAVLVFFQNAQDGAVGGGAQGPMPVVGLVGFRAADGHQLEGISKSIDREIDDDVGAGAQKNIFP